MTKEVIILALITSATTGQILFLALFLWFRNTKHLPNKILGALLFCYSLRIIKSVLLLAFPQISFSSFLIALGVIGMSAIGPLLFFYIRSLLKEDFRLSAKHSWHFLPLLILLPTAFFLPDKQMFYVYQFSVYQIIAYLISIQYYLPEWNFDKSHPYKKWINEILIAGGLISIVFLVQLYSKNRNLYITVSVFAAVIFYIMALKAALHKTVFSTLIKKKKKSNNSFLALIQSKILGEALYLNAELTVSALSHHLKIPVHQVSAAINEEAGMSFNEYLNGFRIKEAAKRLLSPHYQNLSIEGIAYDCGFNSLSAFYSAFKKVYNTTPAKFRQQNLPDLQNQENYIEDPASI